MVYTNKNRVQYKHCTAALATVVHNMNRNCTLQTKNKMFIQLSEMVFFGDIHKKKGDMVFFGGK
jgi:hypothetical protein